MSDHDGLPTYDYNPQHEQESNGGQGTRWYHGYRVYASAQEPPGWDPEVVLYRWADTGAVADDTRPCAACGLEFRPCDHEACVFEADDEFEAWAPTHDPCIGHLEGDVVWACCGHGKEPGHLNVKTVIRLPAYPGWGPQTAAAP